MWKLKGDPKEVPICPRCGFEAHVTKTRYGDRAECCGLWSWNLEPLADAATHEVRRKLWGLISDLTKSLGGMTAMRLVAQRSGVKDVKISRLNEPEARKVLEAAEDVVMDIMSGKIVQKGSGK